MYGVEEEEIKGEKYTVETIKKLHEQWGKIKGNVIMPEESQGLAIKEALEKIYTSGVHLKYAKEVLVTLKYSKNVSSSKTGNLMLDDIINKVEINFDEYR